MPTHSINVNVEKLLQKYSPIRMIFRFNGDGFDGLVWEHQGWSWSPHHVKVFFSDPTQMYAVPKFSPAMDGSMYYIPDPPIMQGAVYHAEEVLYKTGEGFIVDPFNFKQSKEVFIDWLGWMQSVDLWTRENAPFVLSDEIPF